MSALAWAVGFLAYWAAYAAAILSSSDLSLGAAARAGLLGVLPDCLLAPAALAFARRTPWDRAAPWRFVLRHAPGAGAYVGLALLGSILTLAVERRLATGGWSLPPDLRGLAWKGLGLLFVYATLCGVGNALEYARRAARAEALRAEARLAALRARLNPHFILNLLHTLMGLVSRDPALARSALEMLGDALRYALRVQSQGLDEVRLREEWQFVGQYLSLERLRLGERLRSRLEVDPDLLDAVVPAFSLQPLVENAVRHAIAPRADGGRVIVSVRRAGPSLVLAVDDDGAPGGSEARPEGTGVGLRLIRERLAALYGAGARLETGPSTLGGFHAAVTVPLAGGAGSPA